MKTIETLKSDLESRIESLHTDLDDAIGYGLLGETLNEAVFKLLFETDEDFWSIGFKDRIGTLKHFAKVLTAIEDNRTELKFKVLQSKFEELNSRVN